MTVNVLVADDDLDVQKVVTDILSISFKDVVIERVLDANTFRSTIASSNKPFDMYLIASELTDTTGKNILSIMFDEFPEQVSKMAIIEESSETVRFDRSGNMLPLIKKPFSLDEFTNIIKQICPYV